jgi:hypothetical protein
MANEIEGKNLFRKNTVSQKWWISISRVKGIWNIERN